MSGDRGVVSIELSGLDPEAVDTVNYALGILAKHGLGVWEPIPGKGYLVPLYGSDPDATVHIFYIIEDKRGAA